MWSIHEHSYGGLQRRYVDFRGGVLCCVDPLRHKPVAFATELHFENWLLYWAKPEVRQLTTEPARLQCMCRGTRMSLSPDLVIERENVEIQLVTSRLGSAAESLARRLAFVAEAHGFSWSLRTKREIRTDPVTLTNLDRLRQCATLYADEPARQVRRVVLASLHSQPLTTRRELRLLVARDVPDTLLDATLVRLHAAGKLILELSGERYGERTVIRLP
ncbi:hypothetical protein ACTJK4_17365 [Ralstonia sp. 22111]|uniref:hypothetical protein n=1 Tax=Ralstonia sp. 22111 TaxID=3453878 RepID=UPI003F825D2F